MNTKIKKIDRAACKVLRDQLNHELEQVGQKLGIEIHAGNASFDASSVTFKVECVLSGVDRAHETFDRDCYLFHLPTSAWRAKFEFQGKQWILVGLKTRSPKYPILAEKVGESGSYKLPERAVESLKEIPKAVVTDFVPRTA